jgi:hypothetical protein
MEPAVLLTIQREYFHYIITLLPFIATNFVACSPAPGKRPPTEIWAAFLVATTRLLLNALFIEETSSIP